jgi:hypothetical protein
MEHYQHKVSDIFEPEETMDSQYTISDKMWKVIKNEKSETYKTGKDLAIHYSMLIAHIQVPFQQGIGKMVVKYLSINLKKT